MLASTEVLGECSYYIPKIVVPSQPHIFLRDHYQRGRWLRTTNTRACDGHLLQVFDFGLSRLRRCWKAPRLSRVFRVRSEEHTSELQSLMRLSYAVFCLKKKK